MTRASHETLEPLLLELRQLAEQERARQQAEEEEQFRLAYEWWASIDLQRALQLRNEAA